MVCGFIQVDGFQHAGGKQGKNAEVELQKSCSFFQYIQGFAVNPEQFASSMKVFI